MKSKKELRDRVRETIEQQIAYLESDPDLSTKDRIEVITRLLPFVVGKISAAKSGEQIADNDILNSILS
jgi:hypothetical protein